MMEINKVLKKIIVSLLIFIVFGEWGLRLFKGPIRIFYPAGKTFPPIFVKSDTIAFELKPNTDVVHYNYFNEFIKRYHINALGIRGYTEDGDIVMVGDSFIFGMGLNDDETVPYHLEKMASKKVVNAGVPGCTVDSAYLLLKKYSPESTAIFGFFLGNDIDDIKAHDWVVDENNFPIKIINKICYVDNDNHLTAGNPDVSPLKVFMRNNSFFYTVLSESRYKLKWKIDELAHILRKRNRKEPKEDSIEHFKEDEYALKIKRLFVAMKKRHDRLLVLVIVGRTPSAFDLEFKKYIVDFFEKEKIDFINLPNSPDSLYYYRDCHWTSRGARQAARLTYQKLKDLCWL